MKKGNKLKITKTELQRIISEEYSSMVKEASRAEAIKSRISAIDKELGRAPITLSEVDAGGMKGIKSTGWTGAGESDKKYDEKFEKIGSHLKEDEEVDGELDFGGDEVEIDEDAGYFEMKFAELGKELDAKMGGEAPDEEMEIEMDVEMDDMDDMDDMGDETEEVEMDSEDEEDEDELNEDLKEPIEGETPAQDSDARFNDYMEKDKHVNESRKVKTTVLSEGRTSSQKSALNRELDRMKALAKIR